MQLLSDRCDEARGSDTHKLVHFRKIHCVEADDVGGLWLDSHSYTGDLRIPGT